MTILLLISPLVQWSIIPDFGSGDTGSNPVWTMGFCRVCARCAVGKLRAFLLFPLLIRLINCAADLPGQQMIRQLSWQSGHIIPNTFYVRFWHVGGSSPSLIIPGKNIIREIKCPHEYGDSLAVSCEIVGVDKQDWSRPNYEGLPRFESWISYLSDWQRG